MKIAIVEFAGKGGMIHYSFQLARAMHQLGTKVTLITDVHYELEGLDHPFELRPILNLWDPKPGEAGGSPLIRKARRGVRAIRYYREWLRLIGFLRNLDADVVQLGDIRFAADLIPIRLLRRSVPVLADICHNVQPFAGGEGSSGAFESSALEQRLYRSLYQQFDAIFVHYEVNVTGFSRTFPESAGRVVRIVHGNEDIFSELACSTTVEDLRRMLGLAEGDRVVLFFGTLSRYKGIDLLLEAFSSVSAAFPDAMLVIAGYPHSDFSAEEFLRKAAGRGLSDRVRLIARYVDSSEVTAWMKLAAVVVFPYRTVYQSGALHVAQTFGVPIVATRVGAMTEVIRDGETGQLVAPGDTAALASAIVGLLEDPASARRLGAAAAEDAHTRFSWTSVAKTMLDRYDALIAGKH